MDRLEELLEKQKRIKIKRGRGTRIAKFMNRFLLVSSKKMLKICNSLTLLKTILELPVVFVLSSPNREILGESYSKYFFNDSFTHKGA